MEYECKASSTCGKRNESDLRGADDRLAFAVAPADHHLLREEHLLRGDLDAEVSARHHYAVGLVDDLVESARKQYAGCIQKALGETENEKLR